MYLSVTMYISVSLLAFLEFTEDILPCHDNDNNHDCDDIYNEISFTMYLANNPLASLVYTEDILSPHGMMYKSMYEYILM